MRQRELDDILTEQRSMNPRKTMDYWRDGRRGPTKDDILLGTIHKKILGSVGKKWDKIYSKLVKEIPARVRADMENGWWNAWNVEECPMFINGIPYDSAGRYELRKDQVYVDDQGILRKPPLQKKRVREKHAPNWVYFAGNILTTINEVWYELRFEKWDDVKVRNIYRWYSQYTKNYVDHDHSYANDLILGQCSKWTCRNYWGTDIVCTKKLQCGKKMAKRLNAEYKNKVKPVMKT